MFLEFPKAGARINTEEWTLPSAYLAREVTCVIYQPEIEVTLEPLHLLLINDGQDLAPMHFDQILARMYRKEQIYPVLTVGIKAGNRLEEFGISGKADYKGRGAQATAYRQFITEELLPALHYKYEQPEFASYTVAGFSLGALSAFDIAWHHPYIFSRVGGFSGSFWWRSKEATPKNPDKHRIAHKLIRSTNQIPALQFWLQAGTQDEKSDRNQNGIIDSIDDTTSLIQELYRKGYKRDIIKYLELIGGKHDIPTWARIMPNFLCWAFGK
jgi:enterochelin esterase-like enzyme